MQGSTPFCCCEECLLYTEKVRKKIRKIRRFWLRVYISSLCVGPGYSTTVSSLRKELDYLENKFERLFEISTEELEEILDSVIKECNIEHSLVSEDITKDDKCLDSEFECALFKEFLIDFVKLLLDIKKKMVRLNDFFEKEIDRQNDEIFKENEAFSKVADNFLK